VKINRGSEAPFSISGTEVNKGQGITVTATVSEDYPGQGFRGSGLRLSLWPSILLDVRAQKDTEGQLG
jgi:hypothetical protein